MAGAQAAIMAGAPGYADGLRTEALAEDPMGGIWDAMLDTGRKQEIDRVSKPDPAKALCHYDCKCCRDSDLLFEQAQLKILEACVKIVFW